MATAQEAYTIHSGETRNGSNPAPGATAHLVGDTNPRNNVKSALSGQNRHFDPDIGPIFSF